MIWQDIKSNLGSANVFRTPEEYLLFGFSVPLAGLDWASGDLSEPGWSGTAATIKYSAPYRISMRRATSLVFDPTSTILDGLGVLIKANERIIVTWDKVAGHAIRYDLPRNSILLRNSGGYLVKGPLGSDPRTCQKSFFMGKARKVLAAGVSGSSVSVANFDAAGFYSASLTKGIPRSILERRGFIGRTPDVNFRLALIPCGRSSANIVDLCPNVARTGSAPVNTLAFSFSSPAPQDCKIIAEYSGPDNLWKPLAFVDTTQGCSQNGYIHFEPPADWTQTSRWDESSDIGGGLHGSGPKSYWIRLQRRLGDASANGATTSAVRALNVPYVVSTREDNPIELKISQKNVGQTVSFRFVPISADGSANESAALLFNHRIAGKAFA